jgi:hypothetical protein
MALIKIVVGLFLVMLVLGILVTMIIDYIDVYNKFCKQKFGSSMLGIVSFFGAGLFDFSFYEGILYYRDAVAKHQDLFDGLALLGFGSLGIIATFAVCIYLSNRFYGIVTALVLLAGGLIVVPFSVFALLLVVFGGGRTIFIVKE